MKKNSSKNNDELLKWTQTVNNNNERVNRIYKDLCEYEEMLSSTNEDEDTQKIFEILDMIQSIQDITKKLMPSKQEMQENTQHLKQQMSMLEDMLKLVHIQRTQEKLENNELY